VALCIRNKRLLVVKNNGKDFFNGLGGKIEPGETELEALQREAQEEVSCKVKNPVHFQTFEGKANDPGKTIRKSCYLCELEGEIHKDDSEIEEVAWIDRDFKKNGVKLTDMLELYVIPELVKQGLL